MAVRSAERRDREKGHFVVVMTAARKVEWMVDYWVFPRVEYSA